MDAAFWQVMNEIVEALKAAGYNPREQLTGYLRSGKDFYITRQNGAREKIGKLDKVLIQEFLQNMQ